LSERALLKFSRNLLRKLSLPCGCELRHNFSEQRGVTKVRLGCQRREPALAFLRLAPELLDIHLSSVLLGSIEDNRLQT
jgi:hypothetical protein